MRSERSSRRLRSTGRSALALAVVGAVVAGGLTVTAAPAALAADGQVAGTVFRDFNGNGVRDTGNGPRTGVANDVGLAGVTVTARDGLGAVVGTTTSTADGTYALPVAAATSAHLRVEFSAWPQRYSPSGTSAAGSNGTSVQFVDVGATGVDFALNAPEDYAQDSAPILTAIQHAGSPFASEGGTPTSIDSVAVAGVPFTANRTSNQPAGFADRVTLATFGEVGAVGGVVYQASSNSAYAFATMKRQAGLGALGLGGIYRIENVLDASGDLVAGHAVPWFDVTTLGIDLGTAATNTARGLQGPTHAVNDQFGFANSGKIGFGGVTLSPDGKTLYFVNLFDKRLYALDVSVPGAVPTSFQSYDLGLGVSERPWAVTVHDDAVYVGYVTTGETGAGPQPGQSAAAAGLAAHVKTAPVGSLGALAAAAPILDGDLGYAKGDVYGGALAPQSQRWNTWTDTWTWNAYGGVAAGRVAQTGGGWHIYPQAILSSLYFDEDGYLTLGFTDRSAVQGGNRNLAADPSVPGTNYETGSSGDILLAAPGSDGTFTLERNGVAGDRPTTPPSAGRANEGPGNREYYNDGQNRGSNSSHHEVALGSVTGQRGTGTVVSTTYDPLGGIRLAGLGWFTLDSGAFFAGYEVTADGGGTASADGTFQKGGGLGAVSITAELAPVEIGNRVWFDADQDGIQDADEPAIAGVTVELRDATTGAVIATTTTDGDGEYYFRSNEDGFSTTGTYTVAFVKPTSGTVSLQGGASSAFDAVPWTDATFTKAGQGSDPTTNSHADPVTGTTSVTLGGPGRNDHSIDAGFVADTSFTVEKTVNAAGGAAQPGQTFTIDYAAKDFRGQPLTLPSSSTTLSPSQTSAPVTVPVGSSVRVTEPGTGIKTVAIKDPSGADHTGYYSLRDAGTFRFRVDNTLYRPGRFSVTKQVTGAYSLSSPELAGASFTVHYVYPGGSGDLVLNAGNSWTATSGELPYGATVTLTETAKTGAAATVGFGTPTWSAGGAPDGSATLTIGDGTTVARTLTNPTTALTGTFGVTKDVTGTGAGRVPSTTPFTVEYSTNGGTTWTALAPIVDGGTVTGPTLPTGTVVQLREQTRPALVDVAWGPAAFSGTGVTATGETASLTIATGTTAAVLLENPTTPRDGRFSVTKDVTGAGESLLTPTTDFFVDYTSSAGDGRLTVRDGQTTTSPLFPTGTVVTVTEVAPTTGLPAGAAWGTPTLTIDGTTVANGSTLTIGDATVLAVTVVNPTTVTPSVSIHKGDGTGTTIAHEADTVADGETYAVGETRTIVYRVQNTGPEALREVALTDATLAGGTVSSLSWTFPDGSSTAATLDTATGVWSATWAGTFGSGTAAWQPGDVITGTATLTLGATATAHQDRATVTAKGQLSGTPVTDRNDYNAFTGGIQVIKYDGQKADPAVKAGTDWIVPAKPLADASQDANTDATAVKYPVGTAEKVRWVVTNTGNTSLTNLTLTDTTLTGPAVGADWTADLSAFGGPSNYSFATSGAWPGILPPHASFFAEGTLTLPAETKHADRVDVVGTVVVPATDPDGRPTDQPATTPAGAPIPAKKADGSPFTVDDDDPFHAYTGIGPVVDIRKGDGTGTAIAHEADTLAEGETYRAGETRTIVFRTTNTGDEALVDIVLKDTTISGGTVQGLEWTLPDGTKLPATQAGDVWTANWAGPWQPGEVVTGAATLTVAGGSAPHVDRATVDAKGQLSGIPVTSKNDYNAFTGDIQVIKYDGDKADPVIGDATTGWVTPAKPLADPFQDANDADHAVKYAVGTTHPVRWVVTNTGDTWLTNVTLTDTTDLGPAIGADWTADLSAFGGPASYSFATSGPWQGVLPPGASFFANGTLTLTDRLAQHADTVDVVGTVVVPAVGPDGVTPNGQPLLDHGTPVRATVPDPANPGSRIPFTVDDDDPFRAWTGVGPYVDIEKGDGSGTTIVDDADTSVDGQLYENGETRTIVLRVQNTGDEELREVVLKDETLSGAPTGTLAWTLPDGSTLDATATATGWTARWEATFGAGTATWKPGEWITGTATLTLDGGDPHLDRATVDAKGAASGIPVADRDDYHAFTSGIQVIKYDGGGADPAVKDADGHWIVPVKPLVDVAQDANDTRHAVRYDIDAANTVRWVVTNTGSTWLTSIDLGDLTDGGPAVSGWTADLSAFGGPARYDFTVDGTWHGLVPPGASFFAQGSLTLGADEKHADTVTVVGTPVIPAVDADGVPNGDPLLGTDGHPVLVTKDGAPVRISDSDPFHAYTLPAAALAVTGMGGLALALGVPALLAIGFGALLLTGRRRTRAG